MRTKVQGCSVYWRRGKRDGGGMDGCVHNLEGGVLCCFMNGGSCAGGMVALSLVHTVPATVVDSRLPQRMYHAFPSTDTCIRLKTYSYQAIPSSYLHRTVPSSLCIYHSTRPSLHLHTISTYPSHARPLPSSNPKPGVLGAKAKYTISQVPRMLGICIRDCTLHAMDMTRGERPHCIASYMYIHIVHAWCEGR